MVPLLLLTSFHPSPFRDAATSATTDVRRHPVLILATDPLAAALLGAAAELAGQLPYFPAPDESPRDALRRVRPTLALVDCDHADACNEEFAGPAVMTGTRLLLFRSRHTTHDASALAERLGITIVEMPVGHETIANTLRELLD